MRRRDRPIPTIESEAEERRFWERATTPPIAWTGAGPSACDCQTFESSTTSISLRLPVSLLERIKVAAHKRDVPYQSLIKTWLAEKLDAH
jgi:hypothetical protein